MKKVAALIGNVHSLFQVLQGAIDLAVAQVKKPSEDDNPLNVPPTTVTPDIFSLPSKLIPQRLPHPLFLPPRKLIYTQNQNIISGNLQTISDTSTTFTDDSRVPISTK